MNVIYVIIIVVLIVSFITGIVITLFEVKKRKEYELKGKIEVEENPSEVIENEINSMEKTSTLELTGNNYNLVTNNDVVADSNLFEQTLSNDKEKENELENFNNEIINDVIDNSEVVTEEVSTEVVVVDDNIQVDVPNEMELPNDNNNVLSEDTIINEIEIPTEVSDNVYENTEPSTEVFDNDITEGTFIDDLEIPIENTEPSTEAFDDNNLLDVIDNEIVPDNEDFTIQIEEGYTDVDVPVNNKVIKSVAEEVLDFDDDDKINNTNNIVIDNIDNTEKPKDDDYYIPKIISIIDGDVLQ